MSDEHPTADQPEPQPPPPAPESVVGAPAPAPGVQPYAMAPPVTTAQAGPTGKVRSTGVCILLFVVTLGIYGLFWYAMVHGDMKRHSGQGIGGGLAFVIAFFLTIVMVFLTPHEIGGLYERRGRKAPVSALTGLWIILPLVGGFVWFIKTNGALNDYWRSVGAA